MAPGSLTTTTKTSSAPNLVRSARIFIACPGMHAYMYMLSAHQQIEPAQPSRPSAHHCPSLPITGRKAGQPWPGRVELRQRGRFKIAARVEPLPQRRQVQAGLAWAALSLLGCALAALWLLWPCSGLLWLQSDWRSRDRRKGRASRPRRSGPIDAVARGSINPRRWSYCRGRRGLSPPSRGRFISCGGALGMAPAGRIITGHGGQGPDLALSGSPNLELHQREKSLPTGRLLLLVSVLVLLAPSCPPIELPSPARQPVCLAMGIGYWYWHWQSARLPGFVDGCSVGKIGPAVGRPHLAQARACPGPALSPAWSTKNRRAWLVVDIAVDPLPDRGQTLACTSTATLPTLP